MSKIRALSRKIVREFHPERVILFGSYARGTATEDSDVDLLVVMPFEGNSLWKSAEVMIKMDPEFATDFVVKTPESIRQRLAKGDYFVEDILKNGKVLYEAQHS